MPIEGFIGAVFLALISSFFAYWFGRKQTEKAIIFQKRMELYTAMLSAVDVHPTTPLSVLSAQNSDDEEASVNQSLSFFSTHSSEIELFASKKICAATYGMLNYKRKLREDGGFAGCTMRLAAMRDDLKKLIMKEMSLKS